MWIWRINQLGSFHTWISPGFVLIHPKSSSEWRLSWWESHWFLGQPLIFRNTSSFKIQRCIIVSESYIKIPKESPPETPRNCRGLFLRSAVPVPSTCAFSSWLFSCNRAPQLCSFSRGCPGLDHELRWEPDDPIKTWAEILWKHGYGLKTLVYT